MAKKIIVLLSPPLRLSFHISDYVALLLFGAENAVYLPMLIITETCMMFSSVRIGEKAKHLLAVKERIKGCFLCLIDLL